VAWALRLLLLACKKSGVGPLHSKSACANYALLDGLIIF
jgi:hypothetical protein